MAMKILKYFFYFMLFMYMFMSSMAGTITGDTTYTKTAIAIFFFLIFKNTIYSFLKSIFKRISI